MPRKAEQLLLDLLARHAKQIEYMQAEFDLHPIQIADLTDLQEDEYFIRKDSLYVERGDFTFLVAY